MTMMAERGSRRSGRDRTPASVRAADRGALVVAIATLVALFAFGGASREDTLSQLFVRLSALVLIGIALWRTTAERTATIRPQLLFLAAAAALMLIQLVPLPPGIWAALPGRGFYADALRLVGLDTVWRPISLSPDRTLNSLLALLPAAAALVVFGTSGREIDRPVLAALLLLILASALIAAVQLSSGGLYFYAVTNQGAGVGVFANRNHQGLLLALGFPLLAAWVTLGRRQVGSTGLRVVVATAAGAALFPFLLITGSRGGLIAGVLGAIASALLLRPRARLRSWRQRAMLGLPVVLGIAVLALAIGSTRNVALDRLLHSDQPELRLENLPVFLAMIRDYFPVGAGFGTFDALFRHVEPNIQLRPTYLNHAHNDLLEIAIEGGVVAWLLLGAFVVWFARCTIRVFAAAPREDCDVLGRTGAIGIALILVGSVLDYPLRTPLIAGVFALFAVWLQAAAQARVAASAAGGRLAGE